MKTGTLLKILRRIAAIVFGGMLLLFFLDFTRIVPLWFHELAQIQLIPALVNGMIGIVALWIVLTLLFGRVYCSVICPLGILQDVIGRVKKGFHRARKQKKKLRTAYKKPHNIVRYTLLGLAAAALLAGWTSLVLWLDPYSNFGRIATAVFKPVVTGINNLLAAILLRFDIYSVYHYDILYANTLLTVFGLALPAVLAVLVWRRGRVWCNTICPVGNFLGLISRFSLFRVSIDASRCNRCKSCTGNCKSECIDEQRFRIDADRCVACYNCLDSCKQHAVRYRPDGWCRKKTAEIPAKNDRKTTKTTAPIDRSTPDHRLNAFQLSRRRFVQGTAIVLAAAPLAAFAQSDEPGYGTRKRYPLPPGAADDFAKKCTGCQLCVTRCPMQVLRPAFLEHGLLSMMQPLLYFQPGCYCNYDCTVCGDVCPTGAIVPLPVEEKHLRQMGVVHFIEDECVVKKDDQDCGACAEHCPTLAVRMEPYSNGLRIPIIDPQICVGCGACESICPVRPLAIFVEGHTAQTSIDQGRLDAAAGGGPEALDLDAIFDNAFGPAEGSAPAAEGAAEVIDTLKAETPPAEIDFGF
jgi:ferredoxin